MPKKRAAAAARKGSTKRRATGSKSVRTTKRSSLKGEARATEKRKQKRARRNRPRVSVDNNGNDNNAPLAVASTDTTAVDTEAAPPPTVHSQSALHDANNPYAAMLARPRPARVLPRAAMTLPVTWYQPPCPSSSQHSPPPVRLYRRSAAAAALASLCHAVRINVPVNASLNRAIDAVLSIPHAVADARRPHDPEAVTRVGWVALMGNHDRSSLAERITPLWAGRAASLASSGLHIVAPSHTPDDVTPEQRALRVLSSEAHMPWFAARVRAAAHETLMGTPSLLGCGLFDVLPVDTFLVLDLDARGAARPYDIYVVPRVDLLTSRLAPG